MTIVDTDKICADCQQAALDHVQHHKSGVGAAFIYCEETRRGLFLRSFDGEVDAKSLSKPGDREDLEARCLDYWHRWLETAEIKSAEIEFANHVGRPH